MLYTNELNDRNPRYTYNNKINQLLDHSPYISTLKKKGAFMQPLLEDIISQLKNKQVSEDIINKIILLINHYKMSIEG